MKTVSYINLTNGIEAIPENLWWIGDYRFIRIQSTTCEQKLWDKLILELDHDFLMNLALGNNCIIFDYGANKEVPRSIYQGVEFIKYVLNRRWFNKEYKAVCRNHNCTSYFEMVYRNLDRDTKRKLDYFKPFVMKNGIHITCFTSATIHDGDKNYYREILKNVI